MYHSLKADGAVVEKIFDGKGSMIVRATDKVALAELAASLAAADAQEQSTCGDVGEVHEDRYTAARQKWRPAAAAHQELDGAEETSSSSKTMPDDFVGMRVRVVGLKAMPEFESKTGTVLEVSQEPGRVILELDSNQKMNISVKYLQLLNPSKQVSEQGSPAAALSAAVNLPEID